MPSASPLAAVAMGNDSETPQQYFESTQAVFEECYKAAEMNALKAREMSAAQADQSSKENSWKIGDVCWWFNHRAKRGPLYKLARPYAGPFKIKELQGAHVLLEYIDGPLKGQTESSNVGKLSRAFTCLSNEVATVVYQRRECSGHSADNYGSVNTFKSATTVDLNPKQGNSPTKLTKLDKLSRTGNLVAVISTQPYFPFLLSDGNFRDVLRRAQVP